MFSDSWGISCRDDGISLGGDYIVNFAAESQGRGSIFIDLNEPDKRVNDLNATHRAAPVVYSIDTGRNPI